MNASPFRIGPFVSGWIQELPAAIVAQEQLTGTIESLELEGL